jgi:hypothetical protein
MTFLAPGWILVAGLASLATAAIHLISWQLPRAVVLPTARFVPDEPARRAARTIRPSDLPLLALRMAILMSAGLALAQPQFRASPSGAARVIAVERAIDTTALRAVLASLPRGDRRVYVAFDTTARTTGDEAGILEGVSDSAAAVSLSAGLLGAVREARALAREYESVDITLVSTFERQAFDAATMRVRAMWPDSISVVRVPLAPSIETKAQLDVDADVDDPVVAGVRLAQANGLLHASVRLLRAASADVAIASGGGVSVVWPRITADTGQRIDAVQARSATAIGHFIRTPLSDSGRIVAHWRDGRPAATERTSGSGCVRTIGFDVPDVGDFTITPAFQRLAAALLSPCAGKQPRVVAPDSLIAAIASPPATVVNAPDEGRPSGRLAAALMILAVLLSAVELLFRRRSPARRPLESPA